MSPASVPESFAEAAPLLRPRLYGAVPLALRTQILAKQGFEHTGSLTFDVGGEVLIGAVVVSDDNAVAVTRQIAAEAWKVEGSTLYSALKEYRFEGELEAVHKIGEHAFMVSDERLATHLILHPESASAFNVDGDLVALVANSNIVFFGGSNDLVSLGMLAELGARVAEEPEGLVSPVPIVLRDGSWRVFEWPDDPTLAIFVGKLQRMFRAAWADLQAPLFADGTAYVAAPRVFEKDESVVLVATWTRGVETLLPVVDDVLVVDDDGSVAAFAFSDFIQNPGIRSLDTDPPRFHVAADARVPAEPQD